MSSNESNADLPGLMERFISEYNILELEEYTGSDKLNKRAENNPGTLIAADKDTVYCIYTHEVDENEKYIHYAELILQDRSYTEQSSESVVTTSAEEKAKLNLEPNISPADFNNDVFGYAFDWGTDYNTVLDFVSQLSGFEIKKGSSYISISTTNFYSAPEVYKFEFSNGKLSAVSGSLYTMYMGSSAQAGLTNIADTLKGIYGLKDLAPYTKNGRMNAQSHTANSSFIVADDYTIYGLFNIIKSGNSLSCVDFIFADKHESETGINSADAGIMRPWGESTESQKADTTQPSESAGDKTEAANPSSANKTTQVSSCRYSSHLTPGDKAEIINVTALRMYNRPGADQIEGLYAFPEKEFTITDGPQCMNGTVWWRINFLGYSGWAAEMDAEGSYYMQKK